MGAPGLLLPCWAGTAFAFVWQIGECVYVHVSKDGNARNSGCPFGVPLNLAECQT